LIKSTSYLAVLLVPLVTGIQLTYLAVKSVMFLLVLVASAGSDRMKADDVGGSGSDHSADEALGIVSTGASTSPNCTLCAGAVTQEVVVNC